MDSKLFWENLKENKCARCAAPLEISQQTGMHWCKTPGCEFRINEVKFREILNGKRKKKK